MTKHEHGAVHDGNEHDCRDAVTAPSLSTGGGSGIRVPPAVVSAPSDGDSPRRAYGPVERAEAVRIVQEHGGRFGDKSVDRILHHHWPTEELGAPPSARSVRRWLSELHHDRPLPARRYDRLVRRAMGRDIHADGIVHAPSIGDELWWADRRDRGNRRQRRTRWTRPLRRSSATPLGIAVGDVVMVDGSMQRFLGRTATGRLAFAAVYGTTEGGLRRVPVNIIAPTHPNRSR